MQERPPRWHARFMVRVEAPTGGFTATIVNISAQGAQLLGIPVDTLQPFEWLSLSAAGIGIWAQVRWVRFDTCGLLFERELTERELDLARRTAERGRARA